uniref:Uncharacterized protein n=1 Tax=Arundo donax TaxID=35708 RepID=A0A0A9EWX8_ARUDO
MCLKAFSNLPINGFYSLLFLTITTACFSFIFDGVVAGAAVLFRLEHRLKDQREITTAPSLVCHIIKQEHGAFLVSSHAGAAILLKQGNQANAYLPKESTSV